MRLKFRKFILYPLMDLIFNYKTKHTQEIDIDGGVRLGAHPAKNRKLRELDIRYMLFNDWIRYIKCHEFDKVYGRNNI